MRWAKGQEVWLLVSVNRPGRFPTLIGLIIALYLCSVNGLCMRPENRRAILARDLQCLGEDVCCIQETRFSMCDGEYILSGRFELYSACFDRRSRSGQQNDSSY